MNDANRTCLGDEARNIEGTRSELIRLATAFETLHLRGPSLLLNELADDLESSIRAIRFLINQPPS